MRKLNTYVFWIGVIAMVGLSSCTTGKKATNPTIASTSLSGRDKVAFDETFFAGLSAKYAGDFKSASVYFTQCLTIDPSNVAVKYELSDIYIQLGYNSQAITMAFEAAQAEPNNIWFLENLARVYQNGKQYEKSADAYASLIQMNPNEFSYYYELGSAYLHANNAIGAIATYEDLEALMGFENSLSEQLFKLYEMQSMDSKAEQKLIQLKDNNPSEIRYVSMLAAFYKKRGQTTKSVALYEKLKNDYPNDPYVKLALYEYYHELGKTELAFKNLDDAFRSKQVNIDSKMGILLALMDISAQDPKIRKEVQDLLEIMVSVHPNEAKTWAVYGDFLFADGEKQKARSMYLKAIYRDDSKFQIWNQVLFIDSELNDVDSIIVHSTQCIALFPNQVLPHYFNGIGHQQKEEYELAISSLETAKNLAYGMPELEVQIMANLGDAYYRVGNLQKAWLAFDHALRMNPSNDYVLNNYAYYLSVHGDQLDKALEMSKRTIDSNPSSAIYLDTYGWILYKMKDYDQAIKYLKMAVKHDSSSSGEIAEHLGDAQYKAGQVVEALRSWKSALIKGGGSEALEEKIKSKKLAE